MVVVGGGRDACEAARASSRAGAKTLLLASNLDTVAYLGIKPRLEKEPNLDLRQSMAVAVNVVGGKAGGVLTKFGERFDAETVILGLEIDEPMSGELMENLKRVGLKIGSTTSTIKEEKILSAKKGIKGIRPKRDVTHYYLLPNQLKPNFEAKRIAGLYFVGPITNQSSASKI